ncbi:MULTISPECIES: hypothetical protein, partial [Aeromonas]
MNYENSLVIFFRVIECRIFLPLARKEALEMTGYVRNIVNNQDVIPDSILIKGATILSMDESVGNIERGDILISGSTILNAKGDSLRRRWEGNFAGASAPLV